MGAMFSWGLLFVASIAWCGCTDEVSPSQTVSAPVATDPSDDIGLPVELPENAPAEGPGPVSMGGTGGELNPPPEATPVAGEDGGVREQSGGEMAVAVTGDAGMEPTREDASEPDAPTTVTCPQAALAPGDYSESLMHDGLKREFFIHVPPGYDNTQATPLVLNFHGATSNAQQQRTTFSKMDATADDKGFIVVYPEGIGASWNAGACCGTASGDNVDDVGFARALVKHMVANACIDQARVYATGFSNGGRMSYRLACEAADVFAAIAPVAGTKSFPDLNNSPGCKPSRPLSLIDFMGSSDSRIAAQPGQVGEWLAFNGCTDTQPAEVYRNGQHYCEAYTECQGGTSVTFCVIDRGGHCWPGSTPCVLGRTSSASELSANELMWEVFERSSL